MNSGRKPNMSICLAYNKANGYEDEDGYNAEAESCRV